MNTLNTIKRALTAAGATLLLACGAQQTVPDAKMTAEPMAAEPMAAKPMAAETQPAQPAQPLKQNAPTAMAGAVNPMQQRLKQSMLRAVTAISDAREVGADRYASQTLQRAIDQLRTAEQWRDGGRVLDAIAQANLASNTAIVAHTEAKPQHVVAMAKAMQSKQAVSLMAELSADPRTQPMRSDDGIVVAVTGAFLPLDAALSEAGRYKLAELAQLAEKYSTFDLVLSASSTDAESPTRSLIMGQNRALNAETFLTGKGIPATRVRLTGRVGTEGRTLWLRFAPDTQAAVTQTQLTAL